LCYFNNTVPYAVAFAAYQEIGKLHLFGIDYSYSTNVHMAESGRACTEFWLSFCVSRGMKIDVAYGSSLLDTNVPPEERLYGYHRLDDPLVMNIENEELLITRQSELILPEPVDTPIIFGRHDNIVELQETA
jgi:hypothetical protein